MKKRDLIVIISAVAFLCFLSIGTLICPDVDFSENENRYMQGVPTLSLQNLLSGDFSADSEDYLTDQIVFRESWVSGKSKIESALGVRDMNGVYICKDGRLVERITDAEFDWSQYKRNLQQMSMLKQTLEKKDIPFDVMLIPSAASVNEDVLPKNALRFDEEKAFAQAEILLGDSLVDLRSAMCGAEAEEASKMFFRTDHHWTGYGAFVGYREYEKHMGTDAESLTYEGVEPQVLTEEFQGTLYSKVLMSNLGYDTIETPSSALDAEYMVMTDGEMHGSLYFREYLEKKDKYAVYFGGNYGRVDLSMENAKSEDEILIIKDSFANSFVPYILDEYAHITMVDTRYFREDISALAAEYDRVLVLYGIDNVAEQRMVLASGVAE